VMLSWTWRSFDITTGNGGAVQFSMSHCLYFGWEMITASHTDKRIFL
jgi:hypothetical protein